MTRSPLLLSVSALLLLSACQPGEKSGNNIAEGDAAAAINVEADEQAIRGQVDRWLQLVRAKDAAGIAALYAEDGAVMPPNAPIGKGRTAIQQSWASMMQTPGFDLTFVPEQIIISSSGDMALDRGTYRLAVAPNGTGNIPLQLVKANPASGDGAMQGVSYIQRLATQGGTAPATACNEAAKGKKETVGYQADYLFWKAE